MKPTARLYSCLKCHVQVIVCSFCDRGQIYCGELCSQAARAISCRRAEIRYQLTPKGKLNHALRQSRYRAREKEKVTDQGSHPSTHNALLAQVKNKSNQVVITQCHTGIYCHFCNKTVSSWLRREFVRHHATRSPRDLPRLRPP